MPGKLLTVCFLFTILSLSLSGQISPSNDTVSCASVTFQANTSTVVNLGSDDYHSGLLSLGFTFNYFGVNYTQCVVSANGYISFQTALANAFSPWTINAAIPSPANPVNAIMGPWQDIDPSVGGSIRVMRSGVAPNRKFVVEYCGVPMYNCGQPFTGQIILFEGSNNIETHITSKPLCASWNAGAAIHGIQNAAGTVAFVVPGRNYPTTWVAANDGWRFTPTGPATYTVAPVTFSPEVMGTTVSWSVNGVAMGSASSITVNPQTAPDTVIGSIANFGACGGVTSTFIDTVIVYPGGFTLNATGFPTACNVNSGYAVATTSGTGPFNYSWQGFTVNNDTLSGLGVGSYIVIVTDPSGCSRTDTVLITNNSTLDLQLVSSSNASCFGYSDGSASTSVTGAVGAVTYSWNTIPVQTGSFSNTLTNGTWTVIATDANGCQDSVTVVIGAPPAIMVNQLTTASTCTGYNNGTATVSASGGAGGFTYSWNTNPVQTTPGITSLSPGAYIVTITDANGCTEKDTVIVTEPDPIATVLSATPPDCFGGSNGSVTLVSVNGGTPGYTQNWNPSNNNLGAGYVYLIITDNNGCTHKDSVLVTQPDQMNVQITTLETACGHADGAASAQVAGGTAPYSFNWANGVQASDITGLPVGNYQVVVTDAKGCAGTGTAIITDYLGVTAGFTPSDLAGFAPFKVDFTNTSSGANSYYWSFGTGDQDTINTNASYVFNTEGFFDVTLIACYTSACCDSTSLKIEVIDEVIVPNIFTPDNDGVNDFFKLNTTSFLSLSTRIFDRWGKMVFDSEAVDAAWDGRRQGGAESAAGTYFYVINSTRANGEVKTYQGSLTLLRGR